MVQEVRVGSEKPNQDKTRQDKARLDETRQVWILADLGMQVARQKRASQERTRQEKTSEDKTKTRESIEEKRRKGEVCPAMRGRVLTGFQNLLVAQSHSL